MIRIRCSYLESFRRVVDTEYGNADELARAIRGNPDPPNWKMEAGTAWHARLNPATTDERSVEYDFGEDDVDFAVDYIGPGVFEVPGSLEILPGVQLLAKADHLYGLAIQDQKTKFSPADARDYESSLQWRVYLMIHGGAWFRYNLWSFADPKDGYCELKGVTSFRFWPYCGMAEDVRGWAGAFLDWASSRNLLGFLERDPYREAA